MTIEQYLIQYEQIPCILIIKKSISEIVSYFKSEFLRTDSVQDIPDFKLRFSINLKRASMILSYNEKNELTYHSFKSYSGGWRIKDMDPVHPAYLFAAEYIVDLILPHLTDVIDTSYKKESECLVACIEKSLQTSALNVKIQKALEENNIAQHVSLSKQLASLKPFTYCNNEASIFFPHSQNELREIFYDLLEKANKERVYTDIRSDVFYAFVYIDSDQLYIPVTSTIGFDDGTIHIFIRDIVEDDPIYMYGDEINRLFDSVMDAILPGFTYLFPTSSYEDACVLFDEMEHFYKIQTIRHQIDSALEKGDKELFDSLVDTYRKLCITTNEEDE